MADVYRDERVLRLGFAVSGLVAGSEPRLAVNGDEGLAQGINAVP